MVEVGDLVSLPDTIPSPDGTGIVNSLVDTNRLYPGDGATKCAIVTFGNLCWLAIPVDKLTVIEKRPEMISETKKTCPNCGSEALALDGWKARKNGERMQRYRCRACGKKTISPVETKTRPLAPKYPRGSKVRAKEGQHRLSGPGIVLRTRADDGTILVQFKGADARRTVWMRESECIPFDQASPPMPLQRIPQMQAAKSTS